MASSASALRALRIGLSRWSLATIILAVGISLPIAIIAGNLLREAGPAWEHLAGDVLWGYLKDSAILSVAVGILVLIIAVPCAWLIAASEFPGRRIFEWALVLPLALPTYVAAYAYSNLLEITFPIQVWVKRTWGHDTYLLAEMGLRYTIVSLVLASVLYPYVYLAARGAFALQARQSIEAARTLGCGLRGAFFQVALPMARPAIAGGLALVLMEVLNDYGAVSFFGISTLSVGIFRAWLALGDPVSAVRLSAGVMGLIFLLLFLERRSRGRAKFSEKGGRNLPLSRVKLSPPFAFVAILSCLIPLTLGFLLPCYQLTRWALPNFSKVFSSGLAQTVLSSVLLAAGAALLIVTIGTLMAYAARIHPSRIVRGASRIATLGYAVPGAVIAVGVLIPFGWFDRNVSASVLESLDRPPSLLLSGTLFAIIFAYLVRFLAVAHGPAETSMGRSCGQLDEASRSLGHSPLSTLRRVVLPSIRGPLLAAGLLVFIDVLKELPLTLILRPFNFETLATRAYSLASEGRIQDCAVPSLIIVLIGALGAIPLNHLMRSR